uniref:Uncharacterized protein n=1 Tax=Oryza nivara TaxID=4536 RepID=A0A0E0HEX3_ORYNI
MAVGPRLAMQLPSTILTPPPTTQQKQQGIGFGGGRGRGWSWSATRGSLSLPPAALAPSADADTVLPPRHHRQADANAGEREEAAPSTTRRTTSSRRSVTRGSRGRRWPWTRLARTGAPWRARRRRAGPAALGCSPATPSLPHRWLLLSSRWVVPLASSPSPPPPQALTAARSPAPAQVVSSGGFTFPVAIGAAKVVRTIGDELLRESLEVFRPIDE